MKKILFIVFYLTISQVLFSQIRQIDDGFQNLDNSINRNTDSLPDNEIDVKLSGKTKYTDYKIISFKGDTTVVDTTLTIQKEYKFNFLRKDDFELIPFNNQGQTFNNLGYDFSNIKQLPLAGFRAKRFNYYNLEDINYYQVPTPTTEILYKTGLQQGQVLDALFTLNFSRRFNVSLAYKGIRSLGQYRRSLASQGNFRSSFHYTTPKKQYTIKGQVVMQDLTNQENGGLTETSLKAFTENDPVFSKNRGRLDVNLDNAENLLDDKRYYFEHTFKLFSTKDSLQQKEFSNLKLGQSVLLDNQFYKFKQTTATTDFFGDTNKSSGIENTVNYQLFNNAFFLEFNSKYILGRFKVKTNYTNYSYGYNELININAYPDVDKNKLKGNAIGFGANWNAKINQFYLNASATLTPGSARLSGSDFRGEAFYKKDSLFMLKGRLIINSKSPNFNTLLYQSNYNNFNWQNNFSKVNTQNLGGVFESKWGNASLDVTNIDDYVYFNTEGKPEQYSKNINYLKAKISKEFRFGKFALDNTLMYQNVTSGNNVFRVPEFVTRNTFYYNDSWFKGAPLFVNIGVTFKYFTKYKANAYNPLLAEFQLQNDTNIGYPVFDAFFNARVRRTRIYFKIDNVTSDISKKNYFSAPNYPYRDFTIRFGVVWNWFI
ncbi:putative porin [Tenacibaculum sp. UWU-22]|uniref:putative porin n=1 Tax=Tenacibaculum sp. UWU-22 TaxID=3234187 RepID=UPI0034DAD360